MKNFSEDFKPQMRGSVPNGGGFTPEIRLNYAALLGRMLRNWYWFVLAVGVCIGLAWLNLRYTTPVYLAQTSMLIQEQSGGTSGLSKEVIAQELGFENSYVIDNEVHMLRSKYLMQRVVNLLGLDTKFIHQGSVRNTEIYNPESFSLVPADTSATDIAGSPVQYGSVMVRFDNEDNFSLIRAEGDTLSVPYTQPFNIGSREFRLQLTPESPPTDHRSVFEIKVMNPSDVANSYTKALTVSQVERSGVVNLSLTDPIPEKAEDILDALVNAYEQQIVEQQSQTGGLTLSFIEERLGYVTEELYEVESDVASFKRGANLSVDIQTQGANYLAQLNEADAQLAELQVRQELIEEIRNTLTSSNENFEALPVASEIISGVLTDLIVQYNQLIFDRDNKLEGYTQQHPLMATYNEKLNNIRESILRSINSVLRETNERIARIQERIRPLESQMTRIPGNEQKLLQIMRQQEIKQNLFMYLLERREEAALTVAAQVPNTRIIDRAEASPSPISPNKPIIYLLAIGVGLFIPAGTMFLRELLGTTVPTEDEVLNYLPYPIVGRIVKSSEHGKLVVNQSTRTGIAEAFRLLRTNLGFLLPGEQSSVVLVTSSVSGEGKSFISSNLAAALALTKKKVVVVGLDMRKPKLAEMVLKDEGERKNAGLSNYLIGKSSYEDIIRPTVLDRLYIVPSGPLPPNPAELLMENNMGTLIQRLRQDFDVVILDAPPVGIVTDGLLMKDYVNVTLFITRLGVTPKKSMPYINEMVEEGKLPRFNLIVNGINPKAAYGYGYGYYQ
ncbi:capsular exopolysaccharide synthesis family protein [Lewinella aquimaris]|uniref:non-specific protein-tyrosine kinase n=1 Tax=Neolewinella aquimaris TaxID=1835722 RepID=A0A840EAI9_9BACT|nr:polysaccharide biosynthesis tyrosine autokinase [Neolewinella aquimaris]MBB4079028.1 capsular exopolysaccharide synthesis family protein [Neolewinella aquimaris]